LLKQFKSLPQFEGLEEVILKLSQQAGLYSETPKTVIHFEQNTKLKGIGFLMIFIITLV